MTKIRLSDVLYKLPEFRDLIDFLETIKQIAAEKQKIELQIIQQHIMKNIARIAAKEIQVENYVTNNKNGSTQINKNSR